MSDSMITKKALATSLKELMEVTPYQKITVTRICENCGMNRKSFYYHFKDKYDLVNWIFDTELKEIPQMDYGNQTIENRYQLVQEICDYFYLHKNFYQSVLRYKGQNSFYDHMKEYVTPILHERMRYLLGDETLIDTMTLTFFSDAILSALERWLLDPECIPPDEFSEKISKIVFQGIQALYKDIKPYTNE